MLFRFLLERWRIWASVLLVIGLCALTLLSSNPEDYLRYVGLMLQLLGLLTVARGIENMRRLFGIPSVERMVLDRLKRILNSIGPRRGSTLSASLELPAIEASGYGYEWLPTMPGSTPEERIAVLEANMQTVKQLILRTRRELEEEKATIEKRLGSERATRAETDEGLKRLLAEVSVGGLHLQSFGLLCLIFGITFATLPDLIIRVFMSLF